MEVISISNWINLSDFEVVFATVITTFRLNVKIVQSPMELDAQGVHNFSHLNQACCRKFGALESLRHTTTNTIAPQVLLLSGLSMCYMCHCFRWIDVVAA